MIVFDDLELEIALCTYNREEFVKEWLNHYYEGAALRNIGLAIYDSSTNNDTEEFVNLFNKSHKGRKIGYYRIPSETTIGLKPLSPILMSKSRLFGPSFASYLSLGPSERSILVGSFCACGST